MIESLNSNQVLNQLREYVSRPGQLMLANVFPLGYGWECDLIRITSAFCWSEYELKMTRSDYLRDFNKTLCVGHERDGGRWKRVVVAKHELLAGNVNDERIENRPKNFSFVMPEGMVDVQEIPEYCGVITFEVAPVSGKIRFSRARRAKTIKGYKKMTPRQLFNIFLKVRGS